MHVCGIENVSLVSFCKEKGLSQTYNRINNNISLFLPINNYQHNCMGYCTNYM